MYFEAGRRYFDRIGEYEVLLTTPSAMNYFYIGESREKRYISLDLEIKQMIDINVRAERAMQEFIDYCRANGNIYADVSKEQLPMFCSRYEQATGRKLRPVYGVYVRKTPGKHYCMSIVLPSTVLKWMPSCFHGSWKESTHEHVTIYNTAFIWTLLENGLLLGNKHRKPAVSTKKDATLPRINFALAFGGGKEKLKQLFSAETSLPVHEGFGRQRDPDGSIRPAEDTGFRFNRGTWPAALTPIYRRTV